MFVIWKGFSCNLNIEVLVLGKCLLKKRSNGQKKKVVLNLPVTVNFPMRKVSNFMKRLDFVKSTELFVSKWIFNFEIDKLF